MSNSLFRSVIAQRDRAERAAAKLESIRTAAEKAVSGIAMGATQRVSTKVAKAVLLGSPYCVNGRAFSVVGKSVGAGVWELREDAKDD